VRLTSSNELLRRSFRLALLWLFTLNLLGEDSTTPRGSARFSSDARAVYTAASQATPGDGTDISILDEEEGYVYDASGRSIYTEYMVYKVLTQKGAEDWDSISVDWEPWHDQHPALRARVITPDFAVHELDLKTVADAPAQDEDSDIYSDRRVMRGPLPAIAPGSVVEREITIPESVPFSCHSLELELRQGIFSAE